MQKYYADIKLAWDFLIKPKATPQGASSSKIFKSFPVLGAVIGVVAYLLAEILVFFGSASETISVGPALVAAIILLGLSVYVNRGRNIVALSWLGQLLEAIQNRHYEESPISRHYSLFVVNITYFCKLLAYTYLISKGHNEWFIFAFMISLTAYSTTLPQAKLLGVEAEEVSANWITAAVISVVLIILLQNPVAPVLAFAAVFFLTQSVSRLVIKKLEVMNEQLCACFAEGAELVALICALLVLR